MFSTSLYENAGSRVGRTTQTAVTGPFDVCVERARHCWRPIAEWLSPHRATAAVVAQSRALPLGVGLLVFGVLACAINGVGLILRYPDIAGAVLAPSYAALTAALVASRPKHWLWFLAVGASMHAVTHWPRFPLSFVLAADLTNSLAALAASGLLLFFFGGPPRIRGARAVSKFVVSVALIAPGIAAIVGAANVVWHGASTTYWQAYRTSFVSNGLTGLVMTPALAAGFACFIPRRQLGNTVRAREMVVLLLAVCSVSAIAFLGAPGRANLVLSLYAPLPALIWAGWRFGASGTSLALTVVTIAAIGSVDRGRGPLFSPSPDESVFALQVFVLLTAVPLLVLAAVTGTREDLQEMSRSLLAALQAKDAELTTSYRRVDELASRLIGAQEEERKRIARDLHDDFGQRLASLSIGLSNTRWEIPSSESAVREQLAALQEQTKTLAKSLRQLSHELHPGALEYIGLAEALRARCDEVTAQHAVRATLDTTGDWSMVRGDVALCLYRVAQEALRNVVDHAGATTAQVSLVRLDAEILLRVSDDGAGFVTDLADTHRGLGLLSMRERVLTVGGQLDIRSAPGEGTVIEARLPVRNSSPSVSGR